MSSQEHLRAEAGLLLVRKQLDLSCKQFLASAFQRKHPSPNTVRLSTVTRPGGKNVVHTPQPRFGDSVRPFMFDDGILPKISHKKTLSALHTATVSANKAKLVNKLLGTVPPEINPIEDTLPRRTRTTLCQVRSSYCNKFETYQARNCQAPSNLCLAYRSGPHTLEHLFACTFFPTNFNNRDLWSHPREAADFLKSMPSFSHLTLNPPLPPPPPEPPPLAQNPTDG
jgi:hypothetical protein